MGVEVHGTLFILKLMILLDLININKLKEGMRKMILEGFRISSKVLIEFMGDVEREANSHQ